MGRPAPCNPFGVRHPHINPLPAPAYGRTLAILVEWEPFLAVRLLTWQRIQLLSWMVDLMDWRQGLETLGHRKQITCLQKTVKNTKYLGLSGREWTFAEIEFHAARTAASFHVWQSSKVGADLKTIHSMRLYTVSPQCSPARGCMPLSSLRNKQNIA